MPPYPITKYDPFGRVIEALVLRTLLGNEVEDHVGSAVRQLLYGVDLAAVSDHGVVRAELPASFSASGWRSTTMMLVAVSAARHWMPMWPRPPAPMTTQVVPG